MNRHFTKENTRVTNEQVKRCSASFITRGMQNPSETPPPTCSDVAVYKERAGHAGEAVGSWGPRALRVAVRSGPGAAEASSVAPRKDKESPHDPAVPLLGLFPKSGKRGSATCLHAGGRGSVVPSGQDVASTPIRQQVHAHTKRVCAWGGLFSCGKGGMLMPAPAWRGLPDRVLSE